MSKAERMRNGNEWTKKQNTGLYTQPTLEQGATDESMVERIEIQKQKIRDFIKTLKFQ